MSENKIPSEVYEEHVQGETEQSLTAPEEETLEEKVVDTIETTDNPFPEMLEEVTYEELTQEFSKFRVGKIERPEGTVETLGLGVNEQMKARFRPQGEPMTFVSSDDISVTERFLAYAEKLKKDGPNSLSEEELKHMRALYIADRTTVPQTLEGLDYARLNKREGAQWRNGVLNEQNRIVGISVPQDARPKPGEASIGGIRALDLMTELAGLGRRRRVVLPHSGFWISFKTPTLDSYLELTKALSQEKIELGRKTRGAIFSSEQVYIHEMLINYAIRHIIDTNAPSRLPEDLKQLILLPDLITVIWGLMCTHWPNGYKYRHACLATDGCTYVHEDLLNVARLYWVDNNRLTDMHRRHLTRASKEILTYESLREYRDSVALPPSQYIDLPLPALEEGASMKVKLRVPTLEEDAVSGHNWVDGIDNISVDAFSNSPLRGNDRLNYIAMQAQVTELLKYMHWIEAFEYTDEEGNVATVTDRISIQDTLKTYNGDATLRETILTGIRDFITDNTIAVVGFPNFECPHCKKAANTDNSFSQLIAPIDVISAFFIQCQEFLTAERT